MKSNFVLVLSILIIFSAPFACKNNEQEDALSVVHLDTGYLSDYVLYPDDPDSVVHLFYRYLDQRKFRLAYQFVDPRVFGSFDYFSSNKGFGNIKHIKIKSIKSFYTQSLLPCYHYLYFVRVIQTDVNETSRLINVMLKVDTVDNLFRITDFSIIPRFKGSFSANKFFRDRGDIMTFPANMLLKEQEEFYCNWLDTSYYIRSFLFDVHNIEEPLWNFVFIYKEKGSHYVLSDFYLGLNDIHINTLFNTVHDTKHYCFFEISSGGRGAGEALYFYRYYTPWMHKVLEISSTIWHSIYFSEKQADIFTEDYVDTVKVYEKGGTLFLKAKFNSRFQIWYDSPVDTVCGFNSYYQIFKFNFDKMKFVNYKTIGDTTYTDTLVTYGHFDLIKKYIKDCGRFF